VSVSRPCLALTCGDPAGIGPDLCIQLAAELGKRKPPFTLTCLADTQLLADRATLLRQPFSPNDWFVVEHHTLPASCVAGRPDKANAPWVLRLLDRALSGCRSGEFDAMVTAPVQKSIINDAGFAFTGHTEYLAERCGISRPVMLLVGSDLKVALVTTHLPLSQVSASITAAALDETLAIVAADLKRFWHITSPRIAVCGLNPHAGESGYLGREEIEIIAPALARARAAGIDASGPWPADTIFTPRQLANTDVVLAMYHDQGLPTLKYASFGNAVNITLGLPILRTSVDHGTALDLAGTGKADVGSLEAAVDLAAQLAQNLRPAQ
jgi:4-hydroxythreonine-4-phosphate dehydrogenase